MRKKVLAFLLATLFLSSCSFINDAKDGLINAIDEGLGADGPETVVIEGVTYRDGFYGDLWPRNLSYVGQATTIGRNDYYHVENDTFDWVHSDIGVNDCGILYCAESQWEQAHAYYSDPDNFTYYCRVTGERNLQTLHTVPDIDAGMFNALFDFAKDNDYNPFSANLNIETVDLPLPDYTVSPAIVFYCESKDGYFTSFKGYSYHIIDGKIWKVYQYRHGDEQVLRAVAVPEEIGEYLVDFVSQLPKE